MPTKKFIAISGSLRKDSYNTYLLKAAQKIVDETISIELYDISTLPFYNGDLENSFPIEVHQLKEAIEYSDGVIFSTPEYNRSISGVLKNAIDWASRPYGKNSFDRKPVLVLGVSSGQISAAVAQIHLKSIMTYLNAKLVGQPEFYMGGAKTKFNEEGELIDEGSKAVLKKAVDTLIAL